MLTLTLVFLFTSLFLIFFYQTCVKPHNYWKNKGVLQGKSIWLFGENWKLILKQESFAESVQRIYNKFSHVRYFGSYQYNNPVFMVRDPELIKLITIKDFEHFLDHRMWFPEELDPLWSRNLFSLQGEEWKEMRGFLSPAFTSRKMKMMFGLMETTATNLIKYLENQNKDLIELDLRDTFDRYACDVLATTAFGVEVDSLQNKNNEFFKMATEATNFTGLKMMVFFISFFVSPSVLKLLNVKMFSRQVNNFFSNLVDETIKTRDEKGIVRPDMIHLMMEARKGRHEYDVIEEENFDGGLASSRINYTKNLIPKADKMKITNADITAQAVVFIIGGLETLSTLLCFLAYELAVSPEIQEKLRKEINETLKNNDNRGTYEDLQKMKYMDMVVTECLRKWPSGLTMERICTKPYTIPPQQPHEIEITLEKGCLVWIPTMGLHHDPQYYPNPQKFDPERFNDDNRKNLHPYTYLPFGEGPRNCIGNRYAILEAKVVFFNLLKSFEIVPVEKSSIPIKITKNGFNLDGDRFIFGLRKLK